MVTLVYDQWIKFVKTSLCVNLNRKEKQWPSGKTMSNGLVVKALDSQSRGPVFKTAGCLQGRLSLSSSRGR